MQTRLTYDAHILDPAQSVEDATQTAALLEQHCARICPDGSVETQWHYDHIRLHALRN